ncbi:hypothetical protein [Micromonospora sp. NPDC049801]|uniref:hypothetical protein n=1 Tax=unclassified Micromonospora TaxID=2617518 RepID=UPI0033FAB80C
MQSHTPGQQFTQEGAQAGSVAGSPQAPEVAIDRLAQLSQDLEQLAEAILDQCADVSQQDTESDAVELITKVLTLQTRSVTMVECAVAHARYRGVKWRQIGDLLGVSRQAAHAHFSNIVQQHRCPT